MPVPTLIHSTTWLALSTLSKCKNARQAAHLAAPLSKRQKKLPFYNLSGWVMMAEKMEISACVCNV